MNSENEIIEKHSILMKVPEPKEQMTTRLATESDIPWIDELQKHYNKQLGFMPRSWLEGKVKKDQILIAEGIGERGQGIENAHSSSLSPNPSPLTPLGYIIAQDYYLKREELGIVYQLAVAPGRQRSFIGAALLKAQFDRSAYGCRLYCCWCAQDIEANKFWENMGFVPLAHRNGSEDKGRVHIFWQKKIRGNEDAINWWFPSITQGGAMGADRLALPIKPGVHWSDVELIKIPMIGGDRLLDAPKEQKSRTIKPKVSTERQPLTGGLRFAPVEMPKPVEEIKVEKPKRIKKPKLKIDPKFIAASRELRDRYLEQVNEKGFRLESAGKYKLTRNIPHTDNSTPHLNPLPQGERRQYKLLEAA